MLLSIWNTYDSVNILYLDFLASSGFAIDSYYNSTSHFYW